MTIIAALKERFNFEMWLRKDIRVKFKRLSMSLRLSAKELIYACFDFYLYLAGRMPVVISLYTDDKKSVTTVYLRKSRSQIRRIAGIAHDPDTGKRFYVTGRTKVFVDKYYDPQG